jgi:hypothetical protein
MLQYLYSSQTTFGKNDDRCRQVETAWRCNFLLILPTPQDSPVMQYLQFLPTTNTIFPLAEPDDSIDGQAQGSRDSAPPQPEEPDSVAKV